jgi:hypothetical protein
MPINLGSVTLFRGMSPWEILGIYHGRTVSGTGNVNFGATYFKRILLLSSCFSASSFQCSGLFSFVPSFGAFPAELACYDAVFYGAAGVFTDAECPFLKADFLRFCCLPSRPQAGPVCQICKPDQVLINP